MDPAVAHFEICAVDIGGERGDTALVGQRPEAVLGRTDPLTALVYDRARLR